MERTIKITSISHNRLDVMEKWLIASNPDTWRVSRGIKWSEEGTGRRVRGQIELLIHCSCAPGNKLINSCWPIIVPVNGVCICSATAASAAPEEDGDEIKYLWGWTGLLYRLGVGGWRLVHVLNWKLEPLFESPLVMPLIGWRVLLKWWYCGIGICTARSGKWNGLDRPCVARRNTIPEFAVESETSLRLCRGCSEIGKDSLYFCGFIGK